MSDVQSVIRKSREPAGEAGPVSTSPEAPPRIDFRARCGSVSLQDLLLGTSAFPPEVSHLRLRLAVDGTILEGCIGGGDSAPGCADALIGQRLQALLPGRAGRRVRRALREVRRATSLASVHYQLGSRSARRCHQAHFLRSDGNAVVVIVRDATGRAACGSAGHERLRRLCRDVRGRAIEKLRPGDHVCHIFETEAEQRAVIIPFLRCGLEAGEKVIYVVDASSPETILSNLRRGGVGVEDYLEQGALRILSCEQAYLRGGVFDPDRMIELLQSETAGALAEGYRALRVTGEMTWALRDQRHAKPLIDYESRLNGLIPAAAISAICQYDRRRFDAEVLLDVLRTHPVAIIGTELHDNFYFTPASELAVGERHAATLRRWLGNLRERKEAEQALQRSEHDKSLILRSVSELVSYQDRDLTVIWANRAAGESVGVSPEELVGRRCHEIWNDSDSPCPGCPLVAAMESGEPREGEICTPDGRCWLIRGYPARDESGEIAGAVEVTQEITARRRAELQLERERRLFMGGPAVVFRWVADTGWPVEYVSPNVANVFGYPAEDFLSGRITYSEVVHPDDLERVAAEVAEHSASGVACFEQDYRIVRRGGDVRYLYDFTVITRDEAGRITHYEGYVLDVTERKRAEEHQRHLEAQIQQAEKMKSLGVLAGGIAHDFNNLLVGVLGNAGLALERMPTDAPAREFLQRIERAARRAADLTSQLLAYSGKGRFIVEHVQLSELVSEMADLLRASISKKAALRHELRADLPPVEADTTQLRQVIMNLILNASEAIGERCGAITVRTGVVDADRAYLSAMYVDDNLCEGRYVFLEVSDTGCGMSAETLARVFEPFFTTKFTGRGLGLAAVLGIVRGHRGGIRVQSEAGRGTSVTVVLPVARGGANRQGTHPETAKNTPVSGSVLLVDDEPEVLEVASMSVDRVGLHALTAQDGREAVRVFRRHAKEISAVLLDLTMPHLSGDEVFREIRRIRADVPVILSSGYNEQDATSRFDRAGLAGFIQKPYLASELAEKLADAIRPRPHGGP